MLKHKHKFHIFGLVCNMDMCRSRGCFEHCTLTVYFDLCRGTILRSRFSCSRWMLVCKEAFGPHNLARSPGIASFSSMLLTQSDGSLEMLLSILVMPCASILHTLSDRLPGESPLMAWRGGVREVRHGGMVVARKACDTSPVKSVKGWGTCGGECSEFSAALSDWDCSVLASTDHVLKDSEPKTWDSSGVAATGSFIAPKESRLASGWAETSRLSGSGRRLLNRIGLEGSIIIPSSGSINPSLCISVSSSISRPDRTESGGYKQSVIAFGPPTSSLDTLGGSLIFLGVGLFHGSSSWRRYLLEVVIEEMALSEAGFGWHIKGGPASEEDCCWSPIRGSCIAGTWPIWGSMRSILWWRTEPSEPQKGRGPTGGLTLNLVDFLG